MPQDDGRAHVPARRILIDEVNAGQRIDNFLATCLKGLPRARIYRILRKGEVRVNRGRVRQHYRLRAGDEVRVPPVRIRPGTAARSPEPARLGRLERAILFEDEAMLIVDKPAGLAVHGGSGVNLGLIECVRALRPTAKRLELVHRLDRETSGLLMIAKRRSALIELHRVLRETNVHKRYVALVPGPWRGGTRTVDAALRKNVVRSGERIVRPDEQGKAALTRFTPRRETGGAVMVDAVPVTGRTHQIRVHAAMIGHPIAGDAKYGDRGFNRRMRTMGLNRLFLHAAELSLPHPDTGRQLRVESPLPADLTGVLDALGLDPIATGR